MEKRRAPPGDPATRFLPEALAPVHQRRPRRLEEAPGLLGGELAGLLHGREPPSMENLVGGPRADAPEKPPVGQRPPERVGLPAPRRPQPRLIRLPHLQAPRGVGAEPRLAR